MNTKIQIQQQLESVQKRCKERVYSTEEVLKEIEKAKEVSSMVFQDKNVKSVVFQMWQGEKKVGWSYSTTIVEITIDRSGVTDISIRRDKKGYPVYRLLVVFNGYESYSGTHDEKCKKLRKGFKELTKLSLSGDNNIQLV